MPRPWLAAACGVTLAVALAVAPAGSGMGPAIASARPTKLCTPRQTLTGGCGALPLRSCLGIFPADTFKSAVVDSVLEYDDPDWVSVAGPSNTHACADRLSLVPPKPETPATVVLALCEEAENSPGSNGQAAAPKGTCKFEDSGEITFARFPTHKQAERVLFENFCVTESFPGLPGSKIGKIQGLKACLNGQSGYAGVAADNIMVLLKGFAPPATDTTATAAMNKVLAYLLNP